MGKIIENFHVEGEYWRDISVYFPQLGLIPNQERPEGQSVSSKIASAQRNEEEQRGANGCPVPPWKSRVQVYQKQTNRWSARDLQVKKTIWILFSPERFQPLLWNRAIFLYDWVFGETNICLTRQVWLGLIDTKLNKNKTGLGVLLAEGFQTLLLRQPSE